jgi:hypothetical protein
MDGDDPGDGLVPIDDPRVTAFRRWLHAAEHWRSIAAERNDQEAAYDEAGALIAQFRNLAMATPFADVAGHRMAIEWETTVVNPDWPEANERRMLMALSRGVLDFWPAASRNIAIWLAADLTMRAEGSPALMGSNIPTTSRHGYNPWVMDIAKAQTIRLAHYDAGLKGSTWRTEHGKICPGLGDDKRKEWNALVSDPERRDCRRVGELVRRKTPLTLDDAAIQLRATRYEAAILKEWTCGAPFAQRSPTSASAKNSPRR